MYGLWFEARFHMPDASQGCGSVPSGWTCVIKRFVGDVLFIPHASFHEGQLLHFANLHKKLIISLMFIINILGGGAWWGAIILEQPQSRKSCDAAHRSFSLIYLFNLVGAPPLPANINFPCKAICMFPRRLPCNQLMVVLFMQRGWSVSRLFILFPLHLV